MLLELRQSALARDVLGLACDAIVELLEAIATDGATVDSLLKSWPHARAPKRSALEKTLALPIAERNALLEAVRADVRFGEDFSDPLFRFSFPDLSEPTRKAGRELLSSMYDEVFSGSGFEFDPGGRANRVTWEDAFRDANPEAKICPACVSALLEERARGRSLIDADHYLPKARYTALSVHGLNLVPMCKNCNQSLKGGRDPLVHAGSSLALKDIWFPYRRAGIAEIELSFEPDDAELRIDFAGDPEAVERAERFDLIFGLRERWSSILSSVEERLVRSLRELWPELWPELDPDEIGNRLRRLMQRAESDTSTDVRGFLASRYYRWLLETPAAFAALQGRLARAAQS